MERKYLCRSQGEGIELFAAKVVSVYAEVAHYHSVLMNRCKLSLPGRFVSRQLCCILCLGAQNQVDMIVGRNLVLSLCFQMFVDHDGLGPRIRDILLATAICLDSLPEDWSLLSRDYPRD